MLVINFPSIVQQQDLKMANVGTFLDTITDGDISAVRVKNSKNKK